MTNRSRIYGASTILYPGTLREFAETKNCSFYRIPSSIHKTILVLEDPNDVMRTPDNLRKMVLEANRDLVLETKILSDQVYYYDRSAGELRIA